MWVLQLDASLEQAIFVARGQDDLRWYAALCASCICLRFFKAFRANPRLNVAAQTLRRAGSDCAHFLIVFSLMLLGFALVAHTIFGSHIQMFSTLGEAFHSTFLLLMGFIFDTNKTAMLESGTLAVVWVAAFNMFMVVLLLSMIFAIILDMYTEVKVSAGNGPSPLQQIFKMVPKPSARTMMFKRLKRDAHSHIKPISSATASYKGAQGLNGSHDIASANETSNARTTLSEEQLLDILEAFEPLGDTAGHQLVSAESLCQRLQVESRAEHLQIEAVIERAIAQDQNDQNAISLSDSVRVCARADTKIREMGPLVCEFENVARRWEEERKELLAALADAQGSMQIQGVSASYEVMKFEGSEQEASNEKECSCKELPCDREDSPEPEPHTVSTTYQGLIGLSVEEQLKMAAAAQAERHGRLEEAFDRLGKRIDPFLQGSTQEVIVDPKRLEQLEEKVKHLTGILSLVLDSDVLWSRPIKEKNRAPTPPRALILDHGADRLPRAHAQDAGFGGLQGESGRQSRTTRPSSEVW